MIITALKPWSQNDAWSLSLTAGSIHPDKGTVSLTTGSFGFALKARNKEFVNAMEPLLDKLFENIIKTTKETPGLEIMSILEKGMIERAIRMTSGNKVQAASLLGINRNTLRNKMERYGIKESDQYDEKE